MKEQLQHTKGTTAAAQESSATYKAQTNLVKEGEAILGGDRNSVDKALTKNIVLGECHFETAELVLSTESGRRAAQFYRDRLMAGLVDEDEALFDIAELIGQSLKAGRELSQGLHGETSANS